MANLKPMVSWIEPTVINVPDDMRKLLAEVGELW